MAINGEKRKKKRSKIIAAAVNPIFPPNNFILFLLKKIKIGEINIKIAEINTSAIGKLSCPTANEKLLNKNFI